MTIPPFEMMTEALRSQGDIWAGYRKDHSLWFPEDLKEKHGAGTKAKNVYFAGCTASFVEKNIGIASVRLLDEAGVDFTYLGAKENCCATPMLVAGKWDVFEETMKKNISAVKASGADTVITSCPACDMMWRHVYPDRAKKIGIEYGITSKHYSEILSEKINSGEFKFKSGVEKPVTVTLHDAGNGQGSVFLELMKPMFPVLFPILLPKMMSKVMDTMLERVVERIPMPDYMAEQMPELMPRVMDT